MTAGALLRGFPGRRQPSGVSLRPTRQDGLLEHHESSTRSVSLARPTEVVRRRSEPRRDDVELAHEGTRVQSRLDGLRDLKTRWPAALRSTVRGAQSTCRRRVKTDALPAG
jgi:hypothetical protein